MLLKQFQLTLGGRVVVLGTKEPRTGITLRLRPGVAEYRQNQGVGTTVHWRNVGQPAAICGVPQRGYEPIDRCYVRI